MLKRKSPDLVEYTPKRQTMGVSCSYAFSILSPVASIPVFKAMAIGSKASLELFWPLFVRWRKNQWPPRLSNRLPALILEIACENDRPAIFRRFAILSAYSEQNTTLRSFKAFNPHEAISYYCESGLAQKAYAETELLHFSRSNFRRSVLRRIQLNIRQLHFSCQSIRSICYELNLGFIDASAFVLIYTKSAEIRIYADELGMMNPKYGFPIFYNGEPSDNEPYYRVECIPALRSLLGIPIPLFWKRFNNDGWCKPADEKKEAILQREYFLMKKSRPNWIF